MSRLNAMILFYPKESYPRETRICALPDTVKQLSALGVRVGVEAGLGVSLGFSDDAYAKAGAEIFADSKNGFAEASIVARIRPPAEHELDVMTPGTLFIGLLDPFNNPGLLNAFASRKIDAISMEMIPRTTLAQKMDALSSQANLAGYVAVILASERLDKVLPMMMTPAGTISPARVFVIGVGVAGLQAIATAKRLGARVDAFDTRPVVEEQVKSLGAIFVKVDLGETGQTEQGYAKALTPEQLEKQRQAMADVCARSDIVIAAAQVFGRKAPVIVTRDMMTRMRPGSVVVDLAIETGGNVEGAKLDEEIFVNGVRIIGLANLPGRVSAHASQLYASNIQAFIDHFWDKNAKTFTWRMDDEILSGALVTRGGRIVHPQFQPQPNS